MSPDHHSSHSHNEDPHLDSHCLLSRKMPKILGMTWLVTDNGILPYAPLPPCYPAHLISQSVKKSPWNDSASMEYNV